MVPTSGSLSLAHPPTYLFGTPLSQTRWWPCSCSPLFGPVFSSTFTHSYSCPLGAAPPFAELRAVRGLTERPLVDGVLAAVH